MLVDFSEKLVDPEGKVITEPTKMNRVTGEVLEKDEITLGKVSNFALLAEDKEATAEDFLKKGDLSKRIFEAMKNEEDLEISIDEAKKIKDLIFKNQKHPIYYWAANNVLENSGSKAISAAKSPKKKKSA